MEDMMSNGKRVADLVNIFYDTTVPGHHGWAYNLVVDGEHESGSLTSRRKDAGLAALVRQLRKEYRAGTVAIPTADAFARNADGNGWVARG